MLKNKYRQSDNIEDYRKANFIDKTEYVRKGRTAARQPVPSTFKEPMSWQHDDRTDATNARANREKKNSDVAQKTLVSRDMGVAPKKMIKGKFLNPVRIDAELDRASQFKKKK